jgi:hypothetical protein
MTAPDPGSVRATLSLLAAAAVISTSCQTGPGGSLAGFAGLSAGVAQAHADEPPTNLAARSIDSAPVAADAALHSTAPMAAARWYLWRAVFANPAGPALADAASAAENPARGAKP